MADAGSFNADLGINMQFNIDGAGLAEITKTIKEISKGKDLQRYWKDVESATDSASKAIERYSKNVNSKGLAENLLKQINALKAITKNENLSELFPNIELNLDELVESAKKIVPKINSEFSVDSFSQAFKTFDLLKEKALDLREVFNMLANYSDLVSRNSELSRENSQFRELIGDSDVEEVKSKLSEIKRLRDQAEEIFTSFLKVNNVERTDYWGDEKFSDYFDAIRKGSLTATEAISRFKTEYAYLLEEGFKSNNDTFGLEQLQAFSNKLDSIFRQVEETSTKINDIISNGVITKSVENLSMDSSLSDSQRSLFGNLLQDEESLKSITALFQKLIEESNKTSKVDLFNDEQLQQVLSIFDKMEKHLSSLRSIISDVGDGEEFSPLLKMINNVQSSISELATSVKGIGLNMNIDVGSDSEMEAKVQSKIANALQAYQRLFDAIKMSGAGGSVINTNFFEFDINQYDTMMGKLQAYKKFIDNMRNEAKTQYNGKDILYQSVDKTYWTQASAAMGQVTKAFNEMNAASDTNPLKDLFGSGDLSEVISQLGLIVAKLEEISTTASSFKNVFDNGFNVTASVEEIDKLTNRVKELEDELAKIKLNPVNVDKSNISSEMKDVFQGGSSSTEKLEQDIKNIESATDRATESAKEYRKILSQVGEFDIDSKVSAMYKRNDGQLESWTWRAKKDDDGNVLYNQDGQIDYGEPTVTVISKYEQLEKIIVKADNELRNLQRDLEEIKAYDSNASTTNIEAKITDQKEYIRLLEQTVKVISQSDEYLLDEQQIIDARNKAAREYALTMGSKQEKTDAKQSASDEKKRLANIEQVNRALNKQQITIDAIEKTYNKSTNPDLDREVSNQQDLAELAQKKLDIQTKINSLHDQERNSANERDFLKLEKLIAEYKELAKYKLKANNPSKQELGGQNLQTLIQVQISNYDKLITKAEKYGDATTDTVEKLKEQRDILSKIDSDGKYIATADQYYASRDTYKVESAALSAFEAETKAIEQKTQAVKRLKDELEGYNNQIPKKPIDGQRSDYFEGFVQNYKNAIEEARKYLNTLSDSPITKEVKDEWERLIDVIKKAKEEIDAVPNAARGSDADARMKEIDKLTKYLDKNTRISKETREQLEGYLALLKSDDPSVNVKELHTAWTKVAVAEREAGREGKSFLDIFKNKVVYNYAAQLAGYYLSFMDMIRYARNAVSAVQELDTALVDLKKTTTMSASELERFYYDSNDVAKQMGTTTAEIINQASAWSRLGYSTKEASTQMAELSAQFAAISPDLDLDSATDGLVSSMKAFDIEVTNVERDIVDNINRIGNTAATSNGEIVDMLTRSSAAMAAANNTIQETIALETAAVEITRNAETTGTAFKTLSMRIRGYDEETEELSDDLKNISGDIADLTKTASTPGGISLFTDETKQTYKSTYQILKEISDIYDELSDKNRAELLEKLAGKRGGQVVAGLLSNFDAAEKALREMENAAGSADAEMSIVEESIDYKLNKLEQTWVGTAQAIIDRGDFGKAIDALTKLSEAIGWVIDKFGVLGTASVIGGGILGAKNVGINTLVAY